MIRIISGKWKGKKILAPKNFWVRPTTDFAKESLFNILSVKYNFETLTVLDIFAGIGSISYEFASRGCSSITTVDNNGQHIKFISNTSKLLEISQLHILKYEAISFLEMQTKNSYDIIFADPPFDYPLEKYQKLVDTVIDKNIIKKNGVFILEHQSKTLPFASTKKFETRKYGNISFSFIFN